MKENIKYKRIELTDIIVKPDPQNYGFKSIKEYEAVKKHNFETFLKATKKSRKIIFLIISLQIVLLLNVLKNNNNFWFLLFIFLDIMLLPDLRETIDSPKKYIKKQNQERYEKELRKYNKIIGELRYVNLYREENEEIEKELNLPSVSILISEETYDDLYIIYTFKQLKYSHDFIIKLVDELLIKNIISEDYVEGENLSAITELSFALSFLTGFNVISESEANKRNFRWENRKEKLYKKNQGESR